jgi:sugar phosphate isomerase/epimerase
MGEKECTYAFSTLGCPDWTVERIAAEAGRLGFDGVELRGIRRVFDLTKAPELQPATIERTRSLFASAHAPILQLDSSASYCTRDESKLQAAYEETARYVELARRLGASLVRVFGGEVPAGESSAQWAGILSERLKRVGELAERGGVKVGVETHDAWSRYPVLSGVVAAAGSPMLGVLLDVGNGWFAGERFEDGNLFTDGRVASVHIKDIDAEGRYVPLGRGVLPLARVLALLRSAGFTGCISLEWEKGWHPELEEPEVVFPLAIEYLRNHAAS